MELEMNRRSFVAAGLAAAGTLTAGTALAQEAADAQQGDSEETSYDIARTVDADVVVVGAGGAGCAAATRAAQLGLSTVLLEQHAQTGGTTLFTEGLFAVNSHWQEELGTNPDVDDLFTRAMDYHHWLCEGHLFREYINQSGADIAWMESNGVMFKGTSTMCGNTYNTWHLYETRDGEVSGAVYVEQWAAAVEAAGAQIELNTEAVELVSEDGRVCGVIAKQGDEYVQFNAKAGVVLASGGYADNDDMIVELAGVKPGRIQPMGAGGRMGFGIKAAQKLGAALAKAPGTLVYYGGCMPGVTYGSHLYCATSFQPLFWVNQDAQRFVNEYYAERNFSFSGSAQSMQDRVFSILTKAQLDDMVENGGIFGCGEYIKAGEPLTDFWSQYQDQVDAGNEAIQTADTLEELAGKIGVDADALVAEVEKYNGYCAAGKDDEFAKDPQYLRALESGPYYSFELNVGIFTTVGGLKIDEDSEVLTSEGQAIPGLYATGCDTGGLYGDAYDVSICEGSCQGYAVYTGRRAAEAIAAAQGLEVPSILDDAQ